MDHTAKTRKELALGYGICPRTFNKWLKSEDIILPKGLINPKLQEYIESKFGKPANAAS